MEDGPQGGRVPALLWIEFAQMKTSKIRYRNTELHIIIRLVLTIIFKPADPTWSIILQAIAEVNIAQSLLFHSHLTSTLVSAVWIHMHTEDGPAI